ncbi:MAG TPA: nitrate- and nitrite sensing domain-containing protein [Acidimicrobiales bacterium]
MRRIPIRLKLAAALAVPLLALVAVVGVEVSSAAQHADEVSEQAALARAAVGPGGVITRLQSERTWAAVELTGADALGITAPVESYPETRAATDEALDSFKRQTEEADPAVAAAFAPAFEGLEGLDALRADIDNNIATSPTYRTSNNQAFADEMYARYIAMMRPLFDATDQVTLTIDDKTLRDGAQLVNMTSRTIELFVDMARMHLTVGARQGGINDRTEIDAAASRKVLWDKYNAALLAAKPPFDEVIADTYPTEFNQGFTHMVERAMTGELVPTTELIQPLTTTNWGGNKEMREEMAAAVHRTADDLVADARMRERVFAGLALVALVAAFVLTWLVSRSITRPLRSLTAQAKAMAGDRLPRAVMEVLQTPVGEDVAVPQVEPVRVKTRDEVVEVAQALNTVQDTALGLAVEQAVLRRNIADSFVNLGRRNQNLLVRQLDFITSLERVETDPDVLANLFRLDHLATRMRRNAESLLVLAGVEPPRQWVNPVPITDVVRAALGEVEDYQRVAVRDIDPATVVGSTAADLAHLMAELIENALVFSPEDHLVDIRGHNRADGGYVIGVIDTGTGMLAEAMATANRRLAAAESFTVAPSKYLGHYVAGNLAARHGIRVNLSPTIGTRGTTATIELPASLLHQAALPAGSPPAPPLAAGPPPGPAPALELPA